MAAAEAIVAKYDRKKLPRHGEHIEITKHYAKSLLRKMGLVKRHKSREKFAKIFWWNKNEFINSVVKVKKDHSVPDSLILNWDQTGCQLVPGRDWTIEIKGTSKVPLAGIDDNVSFVCD